MNVRVRCHCDVIITRTSNDGDKWWILPKEKDPIGKIEPYKATPWPDTEQQIVMYAVMPARDSKSPMVFSYGVFSSTSTQTGDSIC